MILWKLAISLWARQHSHWVKLLKAHGSKAVSFTLWLFFKKSIPSSFMRSFKLTLFSTAPVVSKCEENLSESIWNLFKINTIFCSHVQREACIAHTMPSEGFPEIYLKVSCCKFCTYRNFHRESFFLLVCVWCCFISILQ